MTSTNLIRKNQFLPQAIPLGSIDAYIQYVNSINILSSEEEKNLIDKMNSGDIQAVKKLVLSHLRFVVHVARRYSGYNLGLSDLIQEGNVGLLEAVKRFDPKANVRLATYAIYWIKSKINDYVIENFKLVKVATTKAQRKLFFKLRSMQKNWFDAKDADFIAETLNVKLKDVFTMVSRLYSRDTLLLDEQPKLEESGTESSNYSVIADNSFSPGDICFESEHMTDIIQNAITELEPRSAQIIKARWLSEKKKTLSQLAQEFNVSIERIRQIEAEALKFLQLKLKPFKD
jgi:RNA polymerase sigma-32 factor